MVRIHGQQITNHKLTLANHYNLEIPVFVNQ